MTQLEIDFGEDSYKNASQHKFSIPKYTPKILPRLPKNKELDIMEQIDLLLKQIGELNHDNLPALYAYILRKYFVEGKNVAEITDLITEGKDDVPVVTRERIRTIVQEIREEMLNGMNSVAHKFTKNFVISEDFIRRINEFSASKIGFVVKEKKWTRHPRLGTIAFMMHKKMITCDTVLPWIKKQAIFVDETIERRQFNPHYASLFYCLQQEVRPMTYEQILDKVTLQRQWKNTTLDCELVKLILDNDEVFEKMGDDIYQMRFEHLNVTQGVARVLYEVKQTNCIDLRRMYYERGGKRQCSSLTIVGKTYSWCVPVGKSMWIYREDGQRQEMPADVIHDFCVKNVQFRFEDVLKHLSEVGIVIKESSARSYIMKDCRRHNVDKNLFCLTEMVKEEDDHLWFAKKKECTRPRKKPWVNLVKKIIRRILEESPEHSMLQKEVLYACKHVFEREKISDRNFYKVIPTIPWISVVKKDDGKAYIELN